MGSYPHKTAHHDVPPRQHRQEYNPEHDVGFLRRHRAVIARVGEWLRKHEGEVGWAAAFAIVFAFVAAWYFDTPEPYRIHVVTNRQADSESLGKVLGPLTAQYRDREHPFKWIGRTPVLVELNILEDAKNDTVRAEAQELLGKDDTLLVMGHLPSEPTEASLPILFSARPQVPYLATIATDNNLVVGCGKQDEKAKPYNCYQKAGFVPLLQLSPTNEEQGKSAVLFATQQGKRHFLIVSDNQPSNRSYRDNMIQAYSDAITAFNNKNKDDPADVVQIYRMEYQLNAETVHQWQPDCILYVGIFGEARSLWNQLSAMVRPKKDVLMIVSDSVIETRGSDQALEAFLARKSPIPVRFTYQSDAAEYNAHDSVSARDAFAIAGQLIEDLNDHGLGLWFRTKAFFHLETVADTRRALVKVMEENAARRTWYAGSKDFEDMEDDYMFMGHARRGALFHVWQLRTQATPSEAMEDVDKWHVPRLQHAKSGAMLASQK